MMPISINCRYIDRMYKCLHPQVKDTLFGCRPVCVLIDCKIGTVCKLQHGFPRPILGVSEGIHPPTQNYLWPSTRNLDLSSSVK